MTAAYVDDNGNLDVLVGSEEGDLLTLLGDGKGKLTPPPFNRGSHVALAAADMDCDGQKDLILANEAGNRVWVELSQGATRFEPSDGGLLGPAATPLAPKQFTLYPLVSVRPSLDYYRSPNVAIQAFRLHTCVDNPRLRP